MTIEEFIMWTCIGTAGIAFICIGIWVIADSLRKPKPSPVHCWNCGEEIIRLKTDGSYRHKNGNGIFCDEKTNRRAYPSGKTWEA